MGDVHCLLVELLDVAGGDEFDLGGVEFVVF